MAQENKIAELLAPYGAFITYVPLRTEVNFSNLITLPTEAVIHEIPPRASLDPVKEAMAAKAAVGDHKTAILIPGRAFDAAGTRHGQGGGWYDRFLAAVPQAWMRVGFCFAPQFSTIPLIRKHWDQTMDMIVVIGTTSVEIHDTRTTT